MCWCSIGLSCALLLVLPFISVVALILLIVTRWSISCWSYNYCFFTISRVIVINVFDLCIAQIILEIVAIFGLMIFCFVRANIFVCRHSCDIHILLAVCSRIVFIKLITLCFSVFIIICMTWSVCILLFMYVNRIFVLLFCCLASRCI